MEKLDRLGWAAGQAIRVFGARIGIRTNCTAGWERLLARFPPGWKSAAQPGVPQLLSVRFPRHAERPGLRQYHLLYDGPVRLIRTLDLDELLDAFESRLHHLVAMGSTHLFFHAGVVGWRGRAILLPGKTLAGKTTLVTALMRAGAEYYSDEFAVIDQKGRVHPYPKPLGVRANGTIEQISRTALELGGKVGRGPIPVGAVVVSRFRAGAHWRPRAITAGQAMLTLLGHCASAQRSPGVAVQTVKQMVSEAVLIRGVRGEADDTALRILRRVDQAALRKPSDSV